MDSAAKGDGLIAERLFEEYLRSQNLRWDYEPELGGKRPDYPIHLPGESLVVEVESLVRPEPIPKEAYSPTHAIREALRRGRKQLIGCDNIPTGIALYSDDMYRGVNPLNMMSASFGPGYQDARSLDRIDAGLPAFRFPRKHECPAGSPKLANPFLSRDQNKSISAVIVLMKYALNDFHVAIWKELLSRQAAGETLRPGASLEVAAQLQSRVAVTSQHDGTVRLVVIENLHARIPFPSDVFRGPFDQRWTWQDEWLRPTWMGATATRMFQEGVPFDLL